MAQLNVAREPSMDEILASIRKIIESNEPGPIGSSAQHAFEDDAGDDIELTIDSEIEAAAFGPAEEQISSLRPASAATDTGRSDAPVASPPPLSLADVAARVRAASERQAVNSVSREPSAAEEARPLDDSPLVTPRLAAVSSSSFPPESRARESSMSGMSPVVEPAPPTAEAAAAPVEAASDQTAGTEGEPGAIVSPAVSRQVARAFDDLAHAVQNGPRRSFDEIAEAMMRPMLQEWLDDNLPTLVERLVREEIERVARGPRR